MESVRFVSNNELYNYKYRESLRVTSVRILCTILCKISTAVKKYEEKLRFVDDPQFRLETDKKYDVPFWNNVCNIVMDMLFLINKYRKWSDLNIEILWLKMNCV